MRSESELLAVIRQCVKDINEPANATFVFTHGLSDADRESQIEPVDEHGSPQAYGEITHLVKDAERALFEILVQQDDFGLVVTAYLWLDEALPVPTDAASIKLLDDAAILQTKPILTPVDTELYIEGVKATVALNVYAPMPLFRALRNLTGSVVEIEQVFGE